MSRFTILPLLFVFILTVPSTMAVAQDDPVAVIQNYYDARNRGDVDGALAFFADDAVLDGGGSRVGVRVPVLAKQQYVRI